MKLSIIVPAYNEAATIGQVLRGLGELSIDKQIVVVDDGSSDGTGELAQEWCERLPELEVVRLDQNRGKGAAIRCGLTRVSGDVVVIQDADLEYEPKDLERLFSEMQHRELPVIYGSRRLGGRSSSYRRRYYWGGVVLSWLTNRLYGSQLTDEPTCYKMVRADLLRSLDLNSEGFEFCPEVTAKILRRGIEIPEIRINYHPRSTKEGKKIRLKDAIVAAWVLVKLRCEKEKRRGPSGDD